MKADQGQRRPPKAKPPVTGAATAVPIPRRPHHYRAGADFERTIRTKLRQDGYTVVKSAGSKTKIDLIGIKPGQLLFVQCKRYGNVGPAERAELVALARMVNAHPIAARREGVRGPITFRLLTGPGPKDWLPWTTDEVTG